jgi:hypothetical protein
LVFYARFQTARPLNEIKRVSSIVEWLTKEGVWIKTSNLKTTVNIRGGFFFGKSPRIANIAAMTQFVRNKLGEQYKEVADFQLIHDTVGKDKSTRTKALVLECA